ncbi:Na/Pi symporter [Rossellomorea vietnamensis]|uniref:Na/Pi symporter n=1 Tax=Rossellomorea vietnamensis TaxID=218284 RepID=A0ACD4C9S6_9BACI|nr:Na/Pi symporter [Rossellomorea vietnamensis]UXH44352.1 Na/Pi symporter [Rossellomorea vietnamensis]WQI95744.1 Na/Pi symporter [Rossellomorea vietnamensis]
MILHGIAFIFFILCFLFGMAWLRSGLFNIANQKIKTWLHYLTSTPVKGVMTGTVVTAFIHSSSAVMVLTVGLASSGLIPFRQTIGIMLGSNIGTTFTLEMFTLDMNYLIVPSMIIGCVLYFFKSPQIRSSGMIFIGFGLIFTSIRAIQWLATPLTTHESLRSYMIQVNEHLVLALLIGCVLTAIIQSSTVVTGVTMGFLAAGSIDLHAGIAIMLGANVGTCITAFIASIGGGTQAKLTAYAHIWLNVMGVALFIPFIPLLGSVVGTLADSPDLQLAHASVLFNLICSLLVLPFANSFARLIEKVHLPKKS